MTSSSLPGSWAVLAADLDAHDTLHRWAAREPALRSAGTAGDLRRLTEPGDPAQADSVLGALVRLAAADNGDDAEALLVLLHLLGPGATRIMKRFRSMCPDPAGLVYGELAAQIRRFPWRRRTRAHAANLLRDTQAALWREMQPYRITQGAPPAEMLVPPDSISLEREPTQGDDRLDLVDLLMWAERTGVVDADDLAMLVELECSQAAQAGSCRENVAAARGISVATVDRHRSRALRALRSAAITYLAA